MAIVSKVSKQDTFESYNSLKLSFTNNQGLYSHFCDCESFCELNSFGIFALCETNLVDSNHSNNSSVKSYLPLVQKDSVAHMHGEGKTLILCVTCPLKTLRIHTYVVLHCVLLGFTSLSVLFLFPLLITLFSFWTGFDAISSIINNRVFQLTSTGGVTFWLKWPKTT